MARPEIIFLDNCLEDDYSYSMQLIGIILTFVRTKLRAVLCISLLLACASTALGKVSCDLSGLKVNQRTFAFGAAVEILADGLDDQSFSSYALDQWAGSLRAREFGGLVLEPTDSIHVEVFGKTIEKLKKGSRYRLKGEIRDGFAFGGGVRISYFLHSIEALESGLEMPKVEGEPIVDLSKMEGKEVELVGKLWSMNGVWWFEYGGKDVYLTGASGRSEIYKVDWHGRRVRVKGIVKQQLRQSIKQITLKTARDLKMYSVIINAQVTLESGVDTSDEGNRFRALYGHSPRLVNGVYQLLAEPSFRRNIMGDETKARLFVERNWPYIEHTLSNANDASKDTIFLRINDLKIDETLRHIYACILAATGDKRGRDYMERLINVGSGNKPEQNIIYLMGEIDSWKHDLPNQMDGGDWVESLGIHCLRVAPGDTAVVSSIPEMLCKKKSKVGVDLMMGLMLNGAAQVEEEKEDMPRDPVKGTGRVDMSGFSRLFSAMDIDPDAMTVADYTSILLPEILSNASGLVTSDQLLKLAEKFPEPDHNRRMLFREMLKRDDPRAISHFWEDLEEDFWSMDLDEYSGPNIIADVKNRITQLKPGNVRNEFQMLLLRREENAAATIAAMLDDPQTPIEKLNELSWELARIEGGKSHVASIARAIRKRLLVKSQKKCDAMTVSGMIGRIGESSDASAVNEMIILLGADFSHLADEWVSVQEFRHHIAGQLAEMTGESFGLDQDAWEKWFAKRTK